MQGRSEGDPERDWRCYPDRDSLRSLCRSSEGYPRPNSQDDLRSNLQDYSRDNMTGDSAGSLQGRLAGCETGTSDQGVESRERRVTSEKHQTLW